MGGDVPAPLQDVRPRVPSLPAVDQPFIDLDQAIGLEPQGKGLMGSLIRYPYDKKGRSAPPVHMIKVTETRDIAPYKWVHPGGER
jgi:hypothetical protein